MDVLDIVTRLHQTPKFKQWYKDNPTSKLVHLFLMIDPGQDVKYDIGFFNFDKKLMTSFVVDDSLKDIEIAETKEVFTQDTTSIRPLDMSRVKIHFNEACERCRELQQKKYTQHQPLKEVVILQNLEAGQVWNVTYITKTFQTLNMKVDAETGKIVEEKLHQIFSFDKGGDQTEKA